MSMTPEQYRQRAEEIFAYVWPEDSDRTLYDVADSARVDLYDAAADLTRTLDKLRDDLIDVQKRVDFDSDEWTDLRDTIDNLKGIEFWVNHMRELAVQLESALEAQDVLTRGVA